MRQLLGKSACALREGLDEIGLRSPAYRTEYQIGD